MKKEYGYPTLKVICQASAGNETAIRERKETDDQLIPIHQANEGCSYRQLGTMEAQRFIRLFWWADYSFKMIRL